MLATSDCSAVVQKDTGPTPTSVRALYTLCGAEHMTRGTLLAPDGTPLSTSPADSSGHKHKKAELAAAQQQARNDPVCVAMADQLDVINTSHGLASGKNKEKLSGKRDLLEVRSGSAVRCSVRL